MASLFKNPMSWVSDVFEKTVSTVGSVFTWVDTAIEYVVEHPYVSLGALAGAAVLIPGVGAALADGMWWLVKKAAMSGAGVVGETLGAAAEVAGAATAAIHEQVLEQAFALPLNYMRSPTL